MFVLLAPFFFTLLIAKNIHSWGAILFGALNTWVWFAMLLILQVGLGGLLLLTITWAQETEALVKKRVKNLEEHRQFWQGIVREFPTHTTAQKAAETLQQLPK